MLYNYFTEKLLGLQGVLIENIEEIDDTIHIYCKLERKIHKCPVCGNHTDKIHDYREQIIKDIPAFGKFVFIHLKKRRYSCSCGKRFYEKNSFLPRFHRMTNRLVAYVLSNAHIICRIQWYLSTILVAFLNQTELISEKVLHISLTKYSILSRSDLSNFLKYLDKQCLVLLGRISKTTLFSGSFKIH